MNERFHIYCGRKTWLEGPAVEQFNRVMTFPGILRGAAFPDLHPGRGVPVGAAFLSEKFLYPALIGNDIGCGMTLFATGVSQRKFKAAKLLRRLGAEPESALRQAALEQLPAMEPAPADPEKMLGTLGHGNHFAEILAVEKIADADVCAALELHKGDVLLLVHSGSRCYGEMLWRETAAVHGDEGLPWDSPDGRAYLERHTRLIEWARFNRRLTAHALGAMAGCVLTELLDCVHNSITPCGEGIFLHRKGASAAEQGKPVVVAGSRGAFSYLVVPQGEGEENLHSLAHGAGRKWNRQSTYDRVRAKHGDVQSLLKTKLGTQVVCPEKSLLYEEAPEAYKEIGSVIADLREFGLASVAAELRPLVNIKP